MSVSLAQALDRTFPPCKEVTTRRFKSTSSGPRDVSPEERLMKHSSKVLKSLIRDNEMYDVALVGLEHLLATQPHLVVPEPPSEDALLRQLRPVFLDRDTEANFTIAVHERVSIVLQRLYPNRFRNQSDDGGKDITGIVWIIEDIFAMNVEFKTSFVCDEKVWNALQEEIESGTEFYWPGLEDKAYDNTTVTRILVQLYAHLVHWSTAVAALCTYDRTMFCRRVGNSLHFSKVYVCGDISPSVARVLVAVLLATSKLTIYPTPDGVSFGHPKSIPPSRGPSRLFESRRKINVQQVAPMSPVIANHADLSEMLLGLPTPGRLLDIRKANSKNQPQDRILDLMRCQLLHVTMATQFAVTLQPILYVRTNLKSSLDPTSQRENPSAPLIDTNNEDPFQTNRSLAIQDTRDIISTTNSASGLDVLPVHLDRHLGYGLIGIGRGGIALENIPVVMKEVETEDAEALVQEAGLYSMMEPILSDSIPLLFGIFQNEEMGTTALLLSDAGATLESWCDLSAAQRTELISIIRRTNSAGIHHGDLKPNNVCIDTHGKVRIIDWHLAEPCGCEEECMELAKLTDDIRRDLP